MERGTANVNPPNTLFPVTRVFRAAGGGLKAVGGVQAVAMIPRIIDGNAIVAFAYAEPQGRYDLANLTTSAEKDGAGWVLNGHKGVVTAAPWATHLLVDRKSTRLNSSP